ncbi:MAG: hypothetical protein KAT70_07470 [Thermoplasmata archaeon]|nr:hypothetical protein [Thermoplasmata archaeon]
MTRHAKKEEKDNCSVEGCKEPSHKSLSRKKAADVLTSTLSQGGRHVHLCKEHYKQYKKATKKDREIERLGW